MRRAVILVAAVYTAAASVMAIPGRAATDVMLHPGQSAFWDGEHVEASGPSNPVPWAPVDSSDVFCGQEPTPCYVYRLRLGDNGVRFRLGLDLVLTGEGVHRDSAFQRQFRLQVFSPDGTKIAEQFNFSYSLELFICFDDRPCDHGPFGFPVEHGSQGTWTVRVIPEDVADWAFRMRARLDTLADLEPAVPSRQPLLPNLRAVPPFEFTFGFPAVSVGNLYGGMEVTGTPQSCTVDESAEHAVSGDGVVRCLRFSAGPENLGPGFLDVRSSDPGSPSRHHPAVQRLYDDGGDVVVDRPVGDFEFHESHGHYHFRAMMRYELFRLQGGALRASADHKQGFCPDDERLAGWEAFDQRRMLTWTEEYASPGGCIDLVEPTMGLTPGWGDVYEWVRPGQFVAMPPDDGDYLVRITVNPDGVLAETDTSDNASFAVVRVTGDTVTVLDRGYGPGPGTGGMPRR